MHSTQAVCITPSVINVSASVTDSIWKFINRIAFKALVFNIHERDAACRSRQWSSRGWGFECHAHECCARTLRRSHCVLAQWRQNRDLCATRRRQEAGRVCLLCFVFYFVMFVFISFKIKWQMSLQTAKFPEFCLTVHQISAYQTAASFLKNVCYILINTLNQYLPLLQVLSRV